MKKYLAIGAAALVSGMAIQATALDSDYDPAAVIYYNAPLSSKANDYANASNFGVQLHHSPASIFKINPYARKSRLKPILDLQLNSRGLQDFKSNGISVLRRDYSLSAEGGIAGIDWAVLVAGVVAAGVVAETVSDDDEERTQSGTGGTTDAAGGDDGGSDGALDTILDATDLGSADVDAVVDAVSDVADQVLDAVTGTDIGAADADTVIDMVDDAVGADLTLTNTRQRRQRAYYGGYGYGDNGG